MAEELLSMGTVVKIEGSNTPLMILGWFQPTIDEEGEITRFSKYTGVPAIMGLQSSKIYNFDEEEIQEILYQGYSSDEEENFKKDTLNWWNTNEQILIHGSKNSEYSSATSLDAKPGPYGF